MFLIGRWPAAFDADCCAQAAAGVELSFHEDPAGLEQPDQIVSDLIGDGLVEDTLVAVAGNSDITAELKNGKDMIT